MHKASFDFINSDKYILATLQKINFHMSWIVLHQQRSNQKPPFFKIPLRQAINFSAVKHGNVEKLEFKRVRHANTLLTLHFHCRFLPQSSTTADVNMCFASEHVGSYSMSLSFGWFHTKKHTHRLRAEFVRGRKEVYSWERSTHKKGVRFHTFTLLHREISEMWYVTKVTRSQQMFVWDKTSV